MFRKCFIPAMAVLALTALTPIDAFAQSDKKGGDKDGEKSKQEGKSKKDEKSSKSEVRSKKDEKSSRNEVRSTRDQRSSRNEVRSTRAQRISKYSGAPARDQRTSRNDGWSASDQQSSRDKGWSTRDRQPLKNEDRIRQDQQSSKSDDQQVDTNKGRSRGQQDRNNSVQEKRNDDRDIKERLQDPLSKSKPSRSGAVRYGTSGNIAPTVKTRGTFTIPEAPRLSGSGRGEREAYREDRTRSHSDFRIGYVQYNNFWNDDWFCYPHYAFNYRPGYCYPSPFYYYSNVPGYVVSARIKIGNFSFQIFADDRYDWNRPRYRRYDDWGRNDRYDDRRYNDVDYAIDDIVTSFEEGDMWSMNDLLPRSGYVQVALEDYADYRMRSDDFYDMLSDIVEGTDTTNYRVRDVRYERDQVVIRAEHEFRDAFGRRDKKYHTIVLDEDRSGFEISYFRVDRRRNW